jgi:hypothetical protein
MWQDLRATDYLLIVFGIWLALLSFYLIRIVGHWRKITKSTKGHNLDQILENILARQNIEAKRIHEVSGEIAKLETLQKGNFSKYALIRFNPFEDTGGDQSFAVAFLDGIGNGIVISSLHSRAGTRIYAKQVLAGKPTNHEFSKEEKEVVEKAARHVH